MKDQSTILKRTQVKPLHEPADIYAALSCLEIGQTVPPQVYVVDYKNGTIPPWTVREIERTSGDLLVITVCDSVERKQATLFEEDLFVGRDIFTCPTKTLAGPFYGYHPGCIHARNPLADIRQHARQIVDRWAKAERQGVA